MSSKSLKSEYQKWLWMLATADLIVVAFFLLPGVGVGGDISKLANWRLLTTVLVPIAVLLLVNVLPHKAKCMLVYWKPYGWMPGSEVFSKFAPDDVRVDMKALAKNVGQLPETPREQNARWYQLYKLVENRTEVAEAHRSFLMYRDMAALSLAFALLTPAGLYLIGAARGAPWLAAAVFASQFVLTALSARWSGVRFVCNVVALHSAKKITGAGPARQPRRATAQQN
ncbi:hypothetical protein [Sphingomonas montana]|uniref:hypothetical protein n=1 Tax=Sphingomonas montana TaxID=1843236 RepID=UPI00096D8FE1|nr:hypothetical protein [Sphingomonas montana]